MKKKVNIPVTKEVIINCCDICESEIKGNLCINQSWEEDKDGKTVGCASIDCLELCSNCYDLLRSKVRAVVVEMKRESSREAS